MHFFDFIGNLFSGNAENSCGDVGGIEINPGSGLPMCGPATDINGNMYGMNDSSSDSCDMFSCDSGCGGWDDSI